MSPSFLKRTLPTLLILAPLAQAEIVSGHVVDENGSPVPGVNINAFDQVTGNEITLFNDGTDANGDFATDIPIGIYTLEFVAPAPPTTKLLILRIPDVLVVGPTNMGTLTMNEGFVLTGRVLDTSGFPIIGLNFDVIDCSTGEDIRPLGDSTDNFGNFTMVVLKTPIEVQLKPNPNNVPLLAPQHYFLHLKADLDMGDITLLPGFWISATVQRTGGIPVKNVDLDAIDPITEDKLYTPGDNTDANGFVDAVVPAGDWIIDFCAPEAERLVTTDIGPVTVTADTNLGIVTLPDGVVLSGTTKSLTTGAIIGKVNLDLWNTATGAAVPLCGDSSDASGNYSLIVPMGTYDVVYIPPYSQPYGSRTYPAVNFTADTTIDALLRDCACSRAGQGVAGTGGFIPRLKTTGGALRIGNPGLHLRITQGRGGALAVVAAGLASGPAGGAVGGGLAIDSSRNLLPPTLIVLDGLTGVGGAGSGGTLLPLPDDPSLVGQTLRARGYVADPAAPNGQAIARRLEGVICN